MAVAPSLCVAAPLTPGTRLPRPSYEREVQARTRDMNESLIKKKQQKSEYENEVDQCTRDGFNGQVHLI